MGYIIEKIAKGEDRWKRCNEHLVPVLTYTAKGLKEGKEYQFRVRAENAAGIGEPSRATPPTKAVDPIDAPKVIMRTSLEVKRGDEIALDATISGSPYPTITWLKDDQVITPEEMKKRVAPTVRRKKGEVQEEEPFVLPLTERLSTDSSKKGEAQLRIRDSVRPDHGVYIIKAENDHGIAKAPCTVSVLGK